jgi:uncharacterized membrane protein
MLRLVLTPISATVLFILLAVSIGTMAVGWGGLEVGEHTGEAKISDSSFCNPADALKMKYINHEISQEEYENMKTAIGVE